MIYQIHWSVEQDLEWTYHIGSLMLTVQKIFCFKLIPFVFV